MAKLTIITPPPYRVQITEGGPGSVDTVAIVGPGGTVTSCLRGDSTADQFQFWVNHLNSAYSAGFTDRSNDLVADTVILARSVMHSAPDGSSVVKHETVTVSIMSPVNLFTPDAAYERYGAWRILQPVPTSDRV
jgi:hypothetical protein